MIQIRVPSLKHLFTAVLVLGLLCALCEIGLRVYDSATAQITRRQLYDRGLTAKSWTVHHSLKPSQTFAVKNPDTQKRVKVSLNSFGLRGPEPAVPKPPGVYRVICLGDETTLATQFAEPETFCGQLQERLQSDTRLPVEVYNAGVPDYCPLLCYLQFKHDLLVLQPDLVICTFDMSDIADDYQYRRLTVMSRAGLPLSCPHPDLDLPKAARASKLDEAFLLPEFVKTQARLWWTDQTFREPSPDIGTVSARYVWLRDEPPDWSRHIEQALSPLESLAELVGRSHGEFVLAVCPAPWQISGDASDGPGVRERLGVQSGQVFQSRKPFETLSEFCRQHGVAWCDPSPAFSQDGNAARLYLQNAPALSRDGHALFAAELSRFLTEQEIGVFGRAPAATPQRPVRQAEALSR